MKIKVFVVGNQTGYARWIENKVLVNDIKEADVVLFTGGEDINPRIYNEEKHPSVYFSNYRDAEELEAFDNCPPQAVKLGICRGMQLLTALAGGKLIQDVNGHCNGSHNMIMNGKTFEITSLHHQMCYPFNLPNDDYKVLAFAENRLSDVYNGKPENMTCDFDVKNEPEVVFYNKINAFGIQGHPEMMDQDSDTVKAFNKMLLSYIEASQSIEDDRYIKFDKIGSDPEFLIADENGKYISSHKIIKGTKSNPQAIPELGDGFAIQVDNVLGEFNVPAVSNRESFVDNMLKMKEYIKGFLSPRKLHSVHLASAHYEEDQLQTKVAKLFGCDPDFNVWERRQNEKPRMTDPTLRSTGFHIHVSYEQDGTDIKKAELLIKAMDLFLGVPSIILDKDKQRRKLYGKAGCFRIQEWGIEYRTLSGYFLSSPDTIGWCYDQTMKAIEFINRIGKDKASELLNSLKERIVECINTGNEEMANDLIKEFSV